MSDSSSVDRWHPSNVEWPTKDRKIKPGPKQVVLQVSGGGFDSYSGFQFAMPSDAYEALYADRGRVLAAARELADAVAHIEAEWVDKPGWLHEPVSVVGVECRNAFAALASFREVDQ